MTQDIEHSQNPTFQLVDEPLDRYLFTFAARGYRFWFHRPEPGPWNEFDLAPAPVPRNPHRLVLRRADGEPQANLAIFFWPVLKDEEPFAHLSLGISDENGEISAAQLLPPGQYELFTTPGVGYRKFGPGEGGSPGRDYRSLGRISWPQDGKPSTINVRVRADDSAPR